jgi:hypothetical protein
MHLRSLGDQVEDGPARFPGIPGTENADPVSFERGGRASDAVVVRQRGVLAERAVDIGIPLGDHRSPPAVVILAAANNSTWDLLADANT